MTEIFEFFSQDHDRLDALIAAFGTESDREEAAELFAHFDSGLRAHIRWEEEILFPAFEEATGMSRGGPTAVMRSEHEQIRRLLQSIRERLPQVGESVKDLIELLTAHNQKEENVLYPWLDRVLAQAVKRDMLDRIQESPPGT